MTHSCVPVVASGRAERMSIHDNLCSAAGKKEETNYRNAHNLSRNGHIIMIICGEITRITRIRFKLMFG